MRNGAVNLVAGARTNWRSAIWIGVAVLAAGLGILVSIVGRVGVAPSAAESTARAFVGAWNSADYRRAYADVDTALTESDFVNALVASAAPIRDARVETIVRQDDHEAVVSYSASVPEALAAVSGVVVANGQRYAGSCVDSNARGARYVRVTDTLVVDRGASGTWKIGFRRDPSAQVQTGVIALAYDLSPRTLYGRVGSSVDLKSAAFDDQVIADALSTYQRDIGTLPTEDATQTTPDQIRQWVKGLAAVCGGPTA
jgi:hypothetical protein